MIVVRARIKLAEGMRYCGRFRWHRVSSFAGSLAIHVVVLAWIWLGPPIEGTKTEKIYDVHWMPLTQPSDKEKIIWYRFRERLPAISPATLSTSEIPRVERKALQQIIAAPTATPGKQFVWMPQPEVEIKPELPTANLLAIDTSLPPPPERPKPKAFEPPPFAETRKPTDPLVLPTAPKISVAAAAGTISAGIPQFPGKPKPRAFEPPPPVAIAPPRKDPALPAPSGIHVGAGVQPSPAALGQNWPNSALPPIPREPTERTQTRASTANLPSGAQANVAAISTEDVNTPRIPKYSSERSIAAGPDAARPGSLAAVAGGIRVPGLSVHGERSNAASNTSIDVAKVSPAPPSRRTGTASPTVSVPLWPHARRLEPLVENRFSGQVVYVTVVNSLLRGSPGKDWTIWFGERETAKQRSRVLMRPPAPLKQLSALTVVSAPSGQGRKIHIAGVVGSNGRLGSLTVLDDAGPEAGMLLKVLEGCEFTPAFRNGVAVDVDVVIEIPDVQRISHGLEAAK